MYSPVLIFLSILVVGKGSDNYMCSKTEETLKLVHVLLRHGDRTNDETTVYPNDPYINETYYPYGLGQLTNKGKKKSFLIGKALRRRYDTFLGDLYTPEVLDAVSTASNRTKMTIQLVLASLYTPKDTELEWNFGLNWQPIPYNYLPFDQDKILTISLTHCKKYQDALFAYMMSAEGRKTQEKYKDLFNYLTEHTGKKVLSTLDVFIIYFGLAAEQEFGLKLPEWTKSVFPDKMKEAAIEQYVINSATAALKKFSGGFFVKEMIKNMKNKIKDTLHPKGRKIYLYSAHDVNIAYVLNALEVYFPHIPSYGAYIILELHEIKGVYGIKILYQDYTSFKLNSLVVSGCEEFCPLDKFIDLIRENLPEETDSCELD